MPILRTRPNLGAAPVPTTSPTRASTPSPTGKPPKTPTKKPTPEPSKKPTKKPIPEPNRSLTSNTLYDIDLGNKSAKCSIKVIASRPVPKNSALKPYINDLVDCYTKVLKGPLAERGFTLTRPKVKTYKGKIETPCGEVGQDGSPAYYCPSNRTIYYPVTADDRNGWYANSRLHYVGLTGHEFGHHLQEVTGLDTGYGSLWQSASKKERLELTRRMELQAQCLEGVTLRYLRKSIKLSERDRAQLRQWHAYTGDEDPPKSRVPDHGTSKAQITWLERGMDSGDFGTCNTWTASPKKVK